MIGHGPMRFRWGWDEEDTGCKALKLVLLRQIWLLYRNGCRDFYAACDPGVGLWCAEIVNGLRGAIPDMRLYCAVPYEEQAAKWAPYLRDRYFDVLEKCTYHPYGADTENGERAVGRLSVYY